MLTERLAFLIDRRPRMVVLVAAALLIVAGSQVSGLAARLTPFGSDDPSTQSVIADQRLHAAGFRDTELVVLLRRTNPRTAAGNAVTLRTVRTLATDPRVQSVVGYPETRSPQFISRDGSSTYLAVALKATTDKARQDAAGEVARRLSSNRLAVVGGPAMVQRQINRQVETGIRTAEMFAFPLLFALSLIFFRGLIAALLPLLVGGLSILAAFLILRLASNVTSVSIFAMNVVTGLGLGLSIDYSLFIINRYREEIAQHGPGLVALRRTLRTAGRTVLFSSLTVAGALASLLTFPQRFLYSMGIGGAAVTLVAAVIATLVLPAFLTLLGARVNAFSPGWLARRAEREAQPDSAGFFYRAAAFTGRAPARTAVLTVAVLIALSVPALGLHFTYPDGGVLPPTTGAHVVNDALHNQFPPYRDAPITIAVAGQQSADEVAKQAGGMPAVAAVQRPIALEHDQFAINVISRYGPITNRSEALVRQLRALPSGPLVTGTTAHYIDMQGSIADHLPIAVAIVVAITVITLFLLTRSIVLPIKQLLMNMLGLGAMYGILTLVFEHAAGAGLLGTVKQAGIEEPQLVLLFAVVFGLSTDYGVFLLSRIKESHDAGLPNGEAISIGLERTGRIVTAAALLFAVAFGAFTTSHLAISKELGFGPAVAVLIDATLIRALLVPALMHLLGRWNWWVPFGVRNRQALTPAPSSTS